MEAAAAVEEPLIIFLVTRQVSAEDRVFQRISDAAARGREKGNPVLVASQQIALIKPTLKEVRTLTLQGARKVITALSPQLKGKPDTTHFSPMNCCASDGLPRGAGWAVTTA